MQKADREALTAIPVAVLAATGMAVAGSQGGASAQGVPIFSLAIAVIFAIQWLAFLPAYLRKTEKFYDLVGGLTYIAIMIMAVCLGPGLDGRSVLLLVLVLIWAVRLGLFLALRVHRIGKDARFDEIKVSFPRFLAAWTLQGLWVTLTLAAALAAITTTTRQGLGVLEGVGALVWLAGFLIELIADEQKRRFRADAVNRGRFIRTGLWSWSRHPNYFGEIVLWVGVAIIAAPVLKGWQWTTLVSPVFVALLLMRISGVPILEQRADEKWGGQADYEAYKASTPVLIPRLRASGSDH